jgi:hypothetical protein
MKNFFKVLLIGLMLMGVAALPGCTYVHNNGGYHGGYHGGWHR